MPNVGLQRTPDAPPDDPYQKYYEEASELLAELRGVVSASAYDNLWDIVVDDLIEQAENVDNY